jgi:hypothetical protein
MTVYDFHTPRRWMPQTRLGHAPSMTRCGTTTRRIPAVWWARAHLGGHRGKVSRSCAGAPPNTAAPGAGLFTPLRAGYLDDPAFDSFYAALEELDMFLLWSGAASSVATPG